MESNKRPFSFDRVDAAYNNIAAGAAGAGAAAAGIVDFNNLADGFSDNLNYAITCAPNKLGGQGQYGIKPVGDPPDYLLRKGTIPF